MDAIRLLKDDHKKVKGLFKRFETATDRERKRAIVNELRDEMEVHEKIEEEIFYPAVRNMNGEEAEEMVEEAEEEHHVADVLLAELKSQRLSDKDFDAKATVLKENIEHHIDEEESEMFPDAKKKLGRDRIDELGDEMAARKNQLMGSKAPANGRAKSKTPARSRSARRVSSAKSSQRSPARRTSARGR